MSVLIKRSNRYPANRYPDAIKNAYSILVEYRKFLEDIGDYDRAKYVEEVYKELWCESLNETPPWK